MVGPSYALLDPLLPASGRYTARWRLQLNIDPETLKGIARPDMIRSAEISKLAYRLRLITTIKKTMF